MPLRTKFCKAHAPRLNQEQHQNNEEEEKALLHADDEDDSHTRSGYQHKTGSGKAYNVKDSLIRITKTEEWRTETEKQDVVKNLVQNINKLSYMHKDLSQAIDAALWLRFYPAAFKNKYARTDKPMVNKRDREQRKQKYLAKEWDELTRIALAEQAKIDAKNERQRLRRLRKEQDIKDRERSKQQPNVQQPTAPTHAQAQAAL